MAKNRVVPEPSKKADHFFNKSKPNFKPQTNFARHNKKFVKPRLQSDNNSHDNPACFKPSVKGGDNFFMKPDSRKNPKKSWPGQQQQHFREETTLLEPSRVGSDSFFVNNSSTNKPSKVFNTELRQKQRTTEDCEKPKLQNKNELGKTEKKPFDKKRYRLQKYSKKYKLDQWEDKRKKAVLRGYYRAIKEDEKKMDVKKIYEEYNNSESGDSESIDEENENNLNNSINRESLVASSEEMVTGDLVEEKIPRNSKEKKGKAFHKAHLEFQRIKGEKVREKDELLKKKTEREEKLKEYKKKKTEKFKKLSRKTKKGQPVMKDRIEMMLEKIQNSMK